MLDAREHGTEEKVKEAPLTLAKQQLAEQNRKIARLEEQLSAAQNISEHKARTIAAGILAGLKARSKPAG